MKITYSEECTLTAQDRWHEIFDFLKKHQVAVVEFKKVDGTIRVLEATFDTALMLPEARDQFHETKIINYEVMPVWSVKDLSWKSFRTMNVISIKEKDD